jgi:hypothetical protein
MSGDKQHEREVPEGAAIPRISTPAPLDAVSDTSSASGQFTEQQVPGLPSPRLKNHQQAGGTTLRSPFNRGVGGMVPSQSNNSLGSAEQEVDNLAIIGDYDMKRSLSTQAFVFDRLSHMNNRKANGRRSTVAANRQQSGGGGGSNGQNILAAHGYLKNPSNSSFYSQDDDDSALGTSSRNGAGMAIGANQEYGEGIDGKLCESLVAHM